MQPFGTRTGQAALALFAASLATIVAAWGFELIGGYQPCALCLQQRWPYYAVVPLSLALVVLLARRPEAELVVRFGLVAGAAILFGGAALGAYHAGVEWQWWPGPQACGGAVALGRGGGGVLPRLDGLNIARCDEAPWRFLGLSFAGWNVAISLALAALALWGARSDAARRAS